ncbi:hypothetical protein AB1Y20_000268 [Prymnesium parvum]|uniref:Uncharacterized protein n=1 Tax=Prymnesium parvum TaxID=97485 RepID=A0AB34K9Y4_PRYPA
MDALSLRWTGLKAARLGLMAAASFGVGAMLELFMIKVWIGDTNFYEVVKRKEAERRLEAELQRRLKPKIPEVITPEVAAELSFGEVLKAQWEEKKRALEREKTRS